MRTVPAAVWPSCKVKCWPFSKSMAATAEAKLQVLSRHGRFLTWRQDDVIGYVPRQEEDNRYKMRHPLLA